MLRIPVAGGTAMRVEQRSPAPDLQCRMNCTALSLGEPIVALTNDRKPGARSGKPVEQVAACSGRPENGNPGAGPEGQDGG